MQRLLRFMLLYTFLLGAQKGFSQHAFQSSLYMQDRYAFNPAFGGMERSLSANLLYRSQWSGLDGNPESRMFNVHLPFYLWNGALGFQVTNESLGAETQTSFLMSYNYIYEATVGLYSTGIRIGIAQNSLDGTKLRAPDGTYEGIIIDHHDVNLPNGMVNGVSPVVEGGFYFAGNFFESGISMTGYYPAGITMDGDIKYSPKPVFHFFGEYFIETFEEISIYPTVYVKSDLAQ